MSKKDKIKHRVKLDGTEMFYRNHILHREDGPALIHKDGKLEWFNNGIRHRDNGPAVIGPKGIYERWYKNGLFHRTDGPCHITYDSKKNIINRSWYINGKNITKEVEKWLKLRKYKYPFTPEIQFEFILMFG